MGLIARARQLAKIDEFKEIFEEVFGMSVEEAKKILLEKSMENKPVEISKEQKEKIDEINQKIVSPQELIEQFATETEEFYPDGNASKH